jgi:hypothetical protein
VQDKRDGIREVCGWEDGVDRGGEMKKRVVHHRLWELREAERVSGPKVWPSVTNDECRTKPMG